MARPLRIEYSGAVYHVTARGDRQETIFDDGRDHTAFSKLLGEGVLRFRWRCHAYCLMGNHYHHLMFETPEANLTQGMRQLNGVFTQWSNRRHQRTGHLFQGRYKAIVVNRGTVIDLPLVFWPAPSKIKAGLLAVGLSSVA